MVYFATVLCANSFVASCLDAYSFFCLDGLNCWWVVHRRQAAPLLTIALDNAKFPTMEAKMSFCCNKCEQYHKDTENESAMRRQLKLARNKKPIKPPKMPSEDARRRFYHLDDHKCSIWHIDPSKEECNLWNGQKGTPKALSGHVTGIPEGKCPTQVRSAALSEVWSGVLPGNKGALDVQLIYFPTVCAGIQHSCHTQKSVSFRGANCQCSTPTIEHEGVT